MIHVSVIVGSYGPFTLGMILGIVSLILMVFLTKNNKVSRFVEKPKEAKDGIKDNQKKFINSNEIILKKLGRINDICYSMSKYSQSLELKYKTDR